MSISKRKILNLFIVYVYLYFYWDDKMGESFLTRFAIGAPKIDVLKVPFC